MQLRGPIFQNFPTPGQNTSIPPHQCSGAMGAPAYVPPKENLLPPLTSENKRPKLKNTRANRSHKMFDARLMRIDLIISRKAFPPLLESFSFPLSTWRPSSFVDQSKKQHDHQQQKILQICPLFRSNIECWSIEVYVGYWYTLQVISFICPSSDIMNFFSHEY